MQVQEEYHINPTSHFKAVSLKGVIEQVCPAIREVLLELYFIMENERLDMVLLNLSYSPKSWVYWVRVILLPSPSKR